MIFERLINFGALAGMQARRLQVLKAAQSRRRPRALFSAIDIPLASVT